METSLKSKILILRNQKRSYNEIAKELNCSKATVCYHCQRLKMINVGLKRLALNEVEVGEIRQYYVTHSTIETAKKFNVSRTTVQKYVNTKRVLLTETEKRKHNYANVKSQRQKIKEKAVAYKGGKCVKCGYDKCLRSLDFHHTDPSQKDFGIGTFTVMRWERVRQELDKCILICSNCHGELHDELEKNKT